VDSLFEFKITAPPLDNIRNFSFDANDGNAQFLQRLPSGGEPFLYDEGHVSRCEGSLLLSGLGK